MMSNEFFLNMLRKNKDKVVIFMTNGAEREGVIVSFDPFSIVILDINNNQVLIQRSAISEIEPQTRVNYIFSDS